MERVEYRWPETSDLGPECNHPTKSKSISIGLNFHCLNGSSTRAANRRSCSSLPTSSQYFIKVMPPSIIIFDKGHQSKEISMLIFGTKPHHVLDACAIVPAAIKNDEFAGGRKMWNITLYI